jgi:hypothetical protein
MLPVHWLVEEAGGNESMHGGMGGGLGYPHWPDTVTQLRGQSADPISWPDSITLSVTRPHGQSMDPVPWPENISLSVPSVSPKPQDCKPSLRGACRLSISQAAAVGDSDRRGLRRVRLQYPRKEVPAKDGVGMAWRGICRHLQRVPRAQEPGVSVFDGVRVCPCMVLMECESVYG